MRTGWLFGTAFAAAVTVAACSSSSASSPFPDVGSFCTGLASAECTGVAAICGNSVSACNTARAAHCNSLATGTAATETDPFSLPAGSARQYTAANAQACIDQVNKTYALRTIGPTDFKTEQTACNEVFQGSAAKNAACTTNADCTGAFICDKNVCATQVSKNITDPCGDPGDVCDPTTSFCATGNARTCTALAASGAICSAAVPCQANLLCTGTCGPKKASGSLCNTSAECDTPAPFCDPNNSNKCDLGLSFAAGAPSCKAFGGT
jgi:hypothetical protein